MIFKRYVDSRPFSDQLAPTTIEPLSIVAKEYSVKGVDISYWQGDIDFSIMKPKVDFVIIRYAYGNKYQDANLYTYYKGAVDNGIAVMAYHYLKAGKSWSEHAQTSAQLLKDYPALYMWGDAEETGGLNKPDLEGWLYKYFNKTLELTQGTWDLPTVGVYTSANFWNSYLPRTDWAKKLKLWVAHWTSGEPLRPNDWLVPNKMYSIHQYSSKGDGSLYGVESTYIDLNGYKGSYDDFNNEFNANIEPQQPPEDYMKVRSIYDSLRVRYAPVNGVVKDYMNAGDVTEALEERLIGSDKWIRVGFNQWCAMYVAGRQYLEYVE